MERRPIGIRPIDTDMSWPLLFSAIVHLALICICRVPEASKANDFTLVDLTISGPVSPGSKGRNENTGIESAGGDKQVSQFHAQPLCPHRENHEPERHFSRSAASDPAPKVSPLTRSTMKPAMRQTTGIGGVSIGATTATWEGVGSAASSHGSAGLDTTGIGTGDGHSAGHGGDGIGKGGNGKGNGDGANRPIDGVLGTPGGPSFAARVSPVYPSFARRIGKEGSVLLRLHLDESGQLIRAEIVHKAGYGFDEAALAAIQASRYRPAMRHGRPIPSRALLAVKFELEE